MNLKFKNRETPIENKKGLTLIEVIIVVAIISVLASIIVPKAVVWIDESETSVALSEGQMFLTVSRAAFVKQYTKKVLPPEDNYVDFNQVDEMNMINMSKAKIAAGIIWEEYGDTVNDMEIISLDNSPVYRRAVRGILYAYDSKPNPFLVKTNKGKGKYVLYDGVEIKIVENEAWSREAMPGQLLNYNKR